MITEPDDALVAQLCQLYRTAAETRGYRGETVEDVLDARFPDDPAMRSRYRDAVIEAQRDRRHQNDHTCRFCGSDHPTNRSRVGHETQAHPIEWQDALDRDQILDDYDADHPLDTIARDHGVSKATVSAIVKEAGRTSRRRKRSA